MKLYQIQRKSDGLMFNGFSPARHRKPRSEPMFTSSGLFYKKLSTLEWNLKWLCSKENPSAENRHNWAWNNRLAGHKRGTPPPYNPKLMKKYNVIIHSVTVNKSEKIAANKLFGE